MRSIKELAALPIMAVAGLSFALAADVTELDRPLPIHEDVDMAPYSGPLRPHHLVHQPQRRLDPQPIGSANVLWNNGEFHGGDPARLGLITHFGTAPGGADSSVIGPPVTLFGGNWTKQGTDPHFRRADDFVVGDGGWTVDSIVVYGYRTGVTGNPFDGATFEANIWAGTPGYGTIIATTTTANTPTFTNIYRQSTGNFPNNTDRAIYEVELVFPGGLELDPGTHWIDVQVVGTPTSAWMPVVTLVDGGGNPFTPVGNSRLLGSDGEWIEPDSGNQTYDLPFLVKGTEHPGACPGDINGDGVVDVSDLLALLAAWGPCADPNDCPADINGDGVVDVSDLLALLAAWGPCPPGGGPTPTGPCCHADFSCSEGVTEADCNAAGGTYGGDFNPCDICPGPPSGESCQQALHIPIGETVVATTEGNAVPDFGPCGGAGAPSGAAAWFTTIGDGNWLTVSACSGNGEARVAVFCNSCDTLTCVAGGSQNNEDPECGNPFDGQALFCSEAGNEYFIAVWRHDTPGMVSVKVTSSGSPCESTLDCGHLDEPICELPTENCQQRSGGTYFVSDTIFGDNGNRVADDFRAEVTGQITSICWEGVNRRVGPIGPCVPDHGNANEFFVTYFNDDNGKPGTEIASFTVHPERARIAWAFDPPRGVYQYTASHAPVSVTAGQCYWIEIQLNTTQGTCQWLWAPSADGNGMVYSNSSPDPYDYEHMRTDADTTNPDRAYCITLEQGEPCPLPLGICCVNGTCTDGVAGEDCHGCLTIGVTCAEVSCIDEADYVYDCGSANNAVGWTAGGVFGWLHRFDVDGAGSDTITQILTVFGNLDGANIGIVPGQEFRVGVFADSGNGPGNLLSPVTVANADADSIGTDVPQAVTITPTSVSGSFYVGVWVEHVAGTFPSPLSQASSGTAGNAWFFGEVEGTFASFDPENPATGPTDLSTTTFAGRWLLRANGL